MDWWNILIFGVLPVLSVVIMFFVKRKYLWTAPLISTTFAFITYMIALGIINHPSKIIKFFSISEYRGFLLLALLFQLIIVIVLTVVAYIAVYILKQNQKGT